MYDPEIGRMERFEWVFQQLETALRQGPALRKRQRRKKREHPDRTAVPMDELERIADSLDAKFLQLAETSSGPAVLNDGGEDLFDVVWKVAADRESEAWGYRQPLPPPALLQAALRAWIEGNGDRSP